ncbi:MAG: hypothetical protein PHZ19_02545 [Candidatus Thermoplasmatota archaeon]|nr:hypothetical protein [Candidatus Thermoplasmatota archaeon]
MEKMMRKFIAIYGPRLLSLSLVVYFSVKNTGLAIAWAICFLALVLEAKFKDPGKPDLD